MDKLIRITTRNKRDGVFTQKDIKVYKESTEFSVEIRPGMIIFTPDAGEVGHNARQYAYRFLEDCEVMSAWLVKPEFYISNLLS